MNEGSQHPSNLKYEGYKVAQPSAFGIAAMQHECHLCSLLQHKNLPVQQFALSVID
ncbi:transposase (fragment) [Enterobacterales bacterium 8AC]